MQCLRSVAHTCHCRAVASRGSDIGFVRRRCSATDGRAAASSRCPGPPSVDELAPLPWKDQFRFGLLALTASLACASTSAVECEKEHARNDFAASSLRRQSSGGDDGSHLVLAADCGGTTTRLMLYRVHPDEEIREKHRPPGTLLKEVKYPNVLFSSLDKIIEVFLVDECQCGMELQLPMVAVLAVAGVVANNTVRYTNLDWVVDGYSLQTALRIPRVEIINDFVAQGYGTLTLGDDEVIHANGATPVQGAPMACIGAGTGLGECFLVADTDGEYRCYPSEGGHVEFAPRGAGCDELQMDLLKHLKIKFSGYNRVSVERVVSGKGICNVYEFLAYKHPYQVDKEVHKQFTMEPHNAATIAMNAAPGSLCERAMQIFAACYGSQVGSLALHFMPFKGLYVTGGVTQKSLDFLQKDDNFMNSYLDKGRLSPLLEKVPLYFVKSDDMGQRGAHFRAVQLLKQQLLGRGPRIARQPAQQFQKDDLPRPRPEFDQHGGHLQTTMAATLTEFQNRVVGERRNRRLPIPEGSEADFEPIFEGDLWKVLKIGDRKNRRDWAKRVMWMSRNGSLVYYSIEEKRNLIYWTAADIRNARVEEVPDTDSIMPFAFKVHPFHDGHECAPSEFAAASEEERQAWIAKIREAQQTVEFKPFEEAVRVHPSLSKRQRL